jgi:hypothetical protein
MKIIKSIHRAHAPASIQVDRQPAHWGACRPSWPVTRSKEGVPWEEIWAPNRTWLLDPRRAWVEELSLAELLAQERQFDFEKHVHGAGDLGSALKETLRFHGYWGGVARRWVQRTEILAARLSHLCDGSSVQVRLKRLEQVDEKIWNVSKNKIKLLSFQTNTTLPLLEDASRTRPGWIFILKEGSPSFKIFRHKGPILLLEMEASYFK